MDPSNDNQPISVDPDERLTDDQETATGLDESGEVEQDSRRISVSSAGMELKDDDALNQSSDFLLKNSRTHPVMISPGENGTSFSGNSSGVVSVDDSVDDVDRLSSYIRSENSIWVRTGNLNRGGDEWRGSPEDGGKITDGDEDQFEQVSLKDPQESNAASESASEADSVRTPMQEKGSLGFEDLNFANTRAGKEFSPDGQNIQEDLLGSPASQKSLNYSRQSSSAFADYWNAKPPV